MPTCFECENVVSKKVNQRRQLIGAATFGPLLAELQKKSMAGYSYNYWTEDSQAAAIFCFICGCNPKVLPQNFGLREANGHGSKMRHKSNGCTNVPNGCCCCFFIQLGVSTFLNHVHTMQRFGRPDVHCPFDFFFGGILPGSP